MTSKKHSILPASSCERWANCPGSVNACKDIPNPPNFYTAEGTVAHTLAEKAIREALNIEQSPDPFDLDSYIGKIIVQDEFEIEVTEEMIDAVIEYRDYVIDLWEKRGRPEIRLEVKIELKEVNVVLWGTGDCVIVAPFDTIDVCDFKYGQGKRVSAYQNKQLMEYALGVMMQEDCTSFTIHICQPRVEDGFTSYTGTSDDIHEFEKKLRVWAAKALDPKAPLIPGDWCKSSFCPARTTCPALRGLTTKVAKLDFLPENLSLEQITNVLKYEDTIKDWMSQVKNHAKELMLQGEELPGYKLVTSLGHAKWIDPAVIVAEFENEYGDKIYKDRELLSPAQFEKMAGKKKLGKDFRDEYTVRPESGYKIVEIDEQGEIVKITTAQEDFNE